MFGKRIELFSLAGFPIRLDPSWFIILFLLSASLATGWFPRQLDEAPRWMNWALGTAGALLLFVSVLVHEISHAVVARSFGITTRGITLFLFGGVAEMTEEPPSARAEFLVAAAGPATSFGIGGLVWLLNGSLQGAAPPALAALLGYVAAINVVLAVFNLLPAFPLDGGRVLRALLWSWKGDLEAATRMSSRAGTFFAGLFVVLGLFQMLGGNLMGGMWIAFIGMFLWSGAKTAYRQLVVKRALEGESVADLMRADLVTVPAAISVQEMVDDYFYRRRQDLFPVVDDGRLVGVVAADDAEGLSEAERQELTAGQLAERADHQEVETVRPDVDARDALQRLGRAGATVLLVVSDGRPEGILSAEDLAHHSEVRRKLEGPAKAEDSSV